jgi:hypothetical protein
MVQAMDSAKNSQQDISQLDKVRAAKYVLYNSQEQPAGQGHQLPRQG